MSIQKSGRLSAPARDLLERAGLAFRESRDRLFCFGESLPIDLLLVRDDDIPGLIADGVCDLGVVGNNVLQEQAIARQQNGAAAAYQPIRQLGFGGRSEEHTSELQSLMRISYAVFCLKKKTNY